MKSFDRYLQAQRIGKVAPYIQPGMRLLDIGASDGALFQQIPGIGRYIGIDPSLDRPVALAPNAQLINGLFPQALPDTEPFDCIALLAVLEHIPPAAQQELSRNCAAYLRTGGHLVVTTPSPFVDHILHVLQFLRVIDGMALDEHYGYDVNQTPALFCASGLSMVKHQRFQLGANHLFVFHKP